MLQLFGPPGLQGAFVAQHSPGRGDDVSWWMTETIGALKGARDHGTVVVVHRLRRDALWPGNLDTCLTQ